MKKTKNRFLAILIFSIVILVSCNSDPQLRIFAVARNEGYLDGCGCPSAPAGGIARRVAEIEKRAGSITKPGLLNFDTGGFSNFLSNEGMIQTKALVRIFDEIKMTAVNVSSRELTGDLALFLSLIAKSKTPFISTNIVDAETGKHYFQPYLLKDYDDKRIVVLGITDITANSWQLGNVTLKVVAPEKALSSALSSLPKETDLIILLAHLPKRKLKNLLDHVKGIDLVLGADGYTLTSDIEKINETYICYPGKQGQYMADISFALSPSGVAHIKLEMVRISDDMAENMSVRKIVDTALDAVEVLQNGQN